MIYSVQYLRAFAAILVLARHISYGFGEEGVDIFFVVSGYIMVHLMHNNPRSSLDFFTARFLRIAPAYYVATVLAILTGQVYLGNVSATSILSSLTFWLADQQRPLLYVGWTLEHEFVFYSLCALCLFFSNSLKATVVALVVGLVLLFIVQDVILFSEKFRGYYIEFLYGMIIYFLLNSTSYSNRGLRKFSKQFYLFLLVVSLLVMVIFHYRITQGNQWYGRFIWAGLPAAVFCYAVLALEGYLPKVKAFILLGDVSYSLYLTHEIVISLYSRVLSDLLGDFLFLKYLIMVIASLAFALLFYYLVERPIRHKLTVEKVVNNKKLQTMFAFFPKVIRDRLSRVNHYDAD